MIASTASELNTEMFAILDARLLEDESTLLVLVLESEEDGEPEIESVRVDLRLVPSVLATWSAKGDNMPELEAQAERSRHGVVKR